MNTRDLEYFHKLAELASFTMVAEFFWCQSANYYLRC